jgi:RND family efflux transporter MFP subunit
MKKFHIVLFIISYLFFIGCGQVSNKDHEAHNHTEENTEHAHDHSNHKISENLESENNNSTHIHNHEQEDHSHEEENDHTQTSDSDEHGHTHSSGQHKHNKESLYHVQTIKPGEFHEVVRTSGEIQSLPKNETTLIAPVSGVVQFADNSVLPGKKVVKNNPLFWISGKSVAEGNLFVELQKARADFNQAKNDYNRAKKLFKDKLMSQKEYLDHKTAFLNHKAEYTTLQSHFSGDQGVVKSPARGYLKEVYVNEGEYVKTGQKIASVLQPESLLLKAEVSQRYAHKVDDFVAANFETSAGKVFSTKELNGKLISGGKSITNQSFYLPVHFKIDTHPGLISGSFAHIYLIGKKKENVITLPKGAFIEEQGNFFVFKQNGDKFIKEPVETGGSDGKNMLVIGGVEPGDKVVTHGAYQIKLKKASSSLPAHGHSH